MVTQEEMNFIESRSWYQTIQFTDTVHSKGCDWCGDPAWNNIKTFLPKDLTGKRILDLGCNSGLFCVKSALLGASEVVGVDWPGWRPGWDFQEQQLFVKMFFEKKYKRSLPIEYIAGYMEDYVNRNDIGKFDYVLAIASIYYTRDPFKVVKDISKITNKVIVRLRDENIISRFRQLFQQCGFVEERVLHEEWSIKLNRPADDFYLYLFTKEEGCNLFRYKFVNSHKDICGSDDLLNIWQLMDIVGTEIPIESYSQKISSSFITEIPLNKFPSLKNHLGGFARLKVTDEMQEVYDWKSLIESIDVRGFLTPIIVEEILVDGVKQYIALEGRHRLSAATAIESFTLESLIPCVVVKDELNNV